MSKSRGFKHLVGATISSVDATCVNEVVLVDANGKHAYHIEVTLGDQGVPVLSLTRRKVETPEQPLKGQRWPFPT